MKKLTNINFIIDAILFIIVMAMGGIGFLMKFILIPGTERWDVYGSNVELKLWGWDRHQWGSLHLILGYVFLALLLLHIILHWNQIKCIFNNMVRRRAHRVIITLIFLILSLVVFLFAFFVPFDVIAVESGQGRKIEPQDQIKTHSQQSIKDSQEKSSRSSGKQKGQNRTVMVNGSMTLEEAGEKYRIPADTLKRLLNIPPETSSSQRLGILRKMYGFRMSDVERSIEKYIESKRE